MNKVNQLVASILGDETKKVVFDYVDRKGERSKKRELVPTEIGVDLVGGGTPDGFRQFKVENMSKVKVVKNVVTPKPVIKSGDFLVYQNGWYQVFNVGGKIHYTVVSAYGNNAPAASATTPTNYAFDTDGFELFFGKFNQDTKKFGNTFTHKTLREVTKKIL